MGSRIPNGYLFKVYEQGVDEMENNAKIQDGSIIMLSISILKLNKLHVLLYLLTYTLRVNILWSVKNIFLLFRLIIYVLYSFIHTFSCLYIGLLFTLTVVVWHESFI